MAELGNVTVAVDLTTPNNIAMLKQLTETLIVIDELRTKNLPIARIPDGPSKYDLLENCIIDAISLIATFAVTAREGDDE